MAAGGAGCWCSRCRSRDTSTRCCSSPARSTACDGGELSITVLHTRFNAIDPSRYPELAFAEVSDGIPPDVAAAGNIVDIIVALNVAMDGGESSSGSSPSPSPSFRDVLALVVAADDEGPQPRPSCLIIDGNLIAAQKAAAELGLPTLVLRTGSAACLGCYLAYPTLLQKGYLPPKESQLYEPVEELPPLQVRDLFYSSDANQELVRKVLGWISETVRNSNSVVINTFDELEPAELERIRGELDNDGVAIVLAASPLHKLSSMNAGSSLHLLPCIKLERGEIKKAINRLMVEKEGVEMRTRAKELKKKVDRCLESSGSSQIAIDKLVNYIISL